MNKNTSVGCWLIFVRVFIGMVPPIPKKKKIDDINDF